METPEHQESMETSTSVQQISTSEFERQAEEYTAEQVERLNAAVRDEPDIGRNSVYFRNPTNVKKGLPVFQGRHTRFVYDDQDDIIDSVDVSKEKQDGPHVRTADELSDSSDGEEMSEEEDETGVSNRFHPYGRTEEKQDVEMGDEEVGDLLSKMQHEMHQVALDEQALLNQAKAADVDMQ